MGQQCESDDGSDAPPSSIAGKEVVEVEIPYVAIVAAAEEDKSYVCKECNVSFSSGKALGGHRSSAHVQANKDHARKKVKKNPDTNHPGGAAAGGEYLCEMCGNGKSFRSRKSLYGHMRCHPDRQWRGMEPPPPPPPRCTAPRPYDDDIEETPVESTAAQGEEMGRADDSEASNSNGPSLNAWARKNKRGANIGLDVFAALQLLNMRNTSEDIVAKDTSIPMGRCGPESCVPMGHLKKVKKEKRISTRDSNFLAPSSVVGDKILEKPSMASRISLIPQDKIDADADGDGKEAQHQHVCGECNKRFKSYQALGGHKSSHYKRIVRIVNTEDEGMEFDLNDMPEDGEA